MKRAVSIFQTGPISLHCVSFMSGPVGTIPRLRKGIWHCGQQVLLIIILSSPERACFLSAGARLSLLYVITTLWRLHGSGSVYSAVSSALSLSPPLDMVGIPQGPASLSPLLWFYLTSQTLEIFQPYRKPGLSPLVPDLNFQLLTGCFTPTPSSTCPILNSFQAVNNQHAPGWLHWPLPL